MSIPHLPVGPIDDHTCSEPSRTIGRYCECIRPHAHTGPHQCWHGWTWRTGRPVLMSDHCWSGLHRPCLTPGCSCPCHSEAAS